MFLKALQVGIQHSVYVCSLFFEALCGRCTTAGKSCVCFLVPSVEEFGHSSSFFTWGPDTVSVGDWTEE